MLGRAAHVDGHHRAQARAGRLLVACLEHRAEPAGRRGERDVVHRAAERALDRLEVLEAGVGDGEAALLADRPVERRVRRGANLVAEQELGERAAAAGELRQLGGMEHGVDAGADAVQQRGRQVREARTAVGRRGRVGRRGAGGRLGGRIEQQVRDVDRADAVDHAVMGLARQRPAAVLEPFEEHHLPERLAALEPVRPELRGPLGELRLAAGRRQRRPPGVAGDVEVRDRAPSSAR